MCLIFDSFPNKSQALAFAADVLVRSKGRINTEICDTQEESDEIDPFPCELTPPIVLVGRVLHLPTENKIRRLARRYGGKFAGT